MTTRTRNTIRLNSADLSLAKDIAAASTPCVGSLREFAKDGEPGRKASYCVLGTVVAAAATRRHISFDSARSILGGEAGIREAIASAIGDETVADRLNVNMLDSDNDDIVNASGEKALVGKLRKWQVGKLNALTKAVRKAELAGTSHRSESSDYAF